MYLKGVVYSSFCSDSWSMLAWFLVRSYSWYSISMLIGGCSYTMISGHGDPNIEVSSSSLGRVIYDVFAQLIARRYFCTLSMICCWGHGGVTELMVGETHRTLLMRLSSRNYGSICSRISVASGICEDACGGGIGWCRLVWWVMRLGMWGIGWNHEILIRRCSQGRV